MFTFTLAHWNAWAPGLNQAADWRQWAHSPYCPLGPGEARPPPLDFLPPLQRRRLSVMARAALACAWPLAEGQQAMPMVFASQHGETSRNFRLLQELVRGEPLSPTSFALSVHNSTAGMWSILRHETTESVALSSENDSLEHALLEAALLLDQGAPSVIVIATEEIAPCEYSQWIEHRRFPFALALRICPGEQFQLGCEAPAKVCGRTQDPSETTQLANPLSFLRNLLLDTPRWEHVGAQRAWHWSRAS
jgi:hypothetical protein